jgi:hypothetical protein
VTCGRVELVWFGWELGNTWVEWSKERRDMWKSEVGMVWVGIGKQSGIRRGVTCGRVQ